MTMTICLYMYMYIENAKNGQFKKKKKRIKKYPFKSPLCIC